MAKLSDITNAALLQLFGAYTTNKGVLSMMSAGTATIKSTNAIVSAINGILYSKAALSTQSIVPTHDALLNPVTVGYVQPAGTTTYLSLGVNAAGALAVVQGSYAGQKSPNDPTVGVGAVFNQGTSYIGNGAVPDMPAGYAPFGVLKVVTAGAATFQPGVTLLDAANVTVTYLDVAVLPAGTP